MRILVEATLPRHDDDRGLLAQASLLFFMYAVSGGRRTLPFLSELQGAHVVAAGRRHARFYWLVREIQHYC
jgi:hypothetical protein